MDSVALMGNQSANRENKRIPKLAEESVYSTKLHQMVGFAISLLDLTLTPEVPEVQCALGSTLSDTGTPVLLSSRACMAVLT